MRTDLAALLVSLTAISVACSSSSNPGSPGTGGSSSSSGAGSSGVGSSTGSSSGGVSNSSGGTAGDGGGSSGTASSGGSSTGSSGGSSGGSTSSSGTSGDAGTSGGADGSMKSLPYPSGPYCTAATGSPAHIAAGCVLPNTSWIGYDDEAANALATTEPYATYSLGNAYADAQKSGKRYAMLNLAEFDCPGCKKSAVEFSAVGDAGVSAGAAVVQAGGVVIELLETAGFVDVASQADLQAWVNDPTATEGPHALQVTSVVDPGTSTTASPSLAFFGQREQAYIIDLTTMKILQYINGDISGIGATSGGLAMTAMHKLLGK